MMLTWFARDDTPMLTGSRVILRAPRAGDYTAWRDLRRSSREFLKPYEPRWTESDLSQRVYASRLKRGREEAKAGTDYSFFIFTRSEDQLLERMHRIEHGLGYVSKLAITRGGYQLVQHRNSRAAELYAPANDPRAEHDLTDAEPERAAALAANLARVRRDMLLRPLCELRAR